MPIGKNSLKRVSDGGYSKLKTEAPDMQHSTVMEKLTPPTATDELIQAEKPKAKRRTAHSRGEEKIEAIKAEVERMKAESAKAKRVARSKTVAEPEKAEQTAEEGFEADFIAVGDDMPVYLL